MPVLVLPGWDDQFLLYRTPNPYFSSNEAYSGAAILTRRPFTGFDIMDQDDIKIISYQAIMLSSPLIKLWHLNGDKRTKSGRCLNFVGIESF